MLLQGSRGSSIVVEPINTGTAIVKAKLKDKAFAVSCLTVTLNCLPEFQCLTWAKKKFKGKKFSFQRTATKFVYICINGCFYTSNNG